MFRILLIITLVFIISSINAKPNLNLTQAKSELNYIVAHRVCGKFTNIIFSKNNTPYIMIFDALDEEQQSTILRFIFTFPSNKRNIIENSINIQRIATLTCER